MKRSYKVLSLVIFTIFIVGLAGCSNSTSGDGKKTSQTKDTLTVGIWGGNDAESRAIEQVKANFEKETGATVKFKVYTDYNIQLEADLVAKTAPDVFYVDSSLSENLIDLDVLLPVDESEFAIEQFYPNLLAAFTGDDGTLYAVPKDFSTIARYVNVDLLNSVGMTTSDIPHSLEEYVTFLPELQAKLDAEYGKGKVTASSSTPELSRLLHTLMRDGGEPVTEDGQANLSDDAVLANLNFVKALTATGAYKTPEEMGVGWNGEAFGSEKIVMMEEGNWVYGTLKQDFSDINFEVLNMPTYKDEVTSMLFTAGYGIYKHSANAPLAKQWVQYATGVDGMKVWSEGAGVLPSRPDVVAKMSDQLSAPLQVHIDQVDHAIPWQLGLHMTVINDAFNNFVIQAMNGELSMEEAMNKVDTQANGQIANR